MTGSAAILVNEPVALMATALMVGSAGNAGSELRYTTSPYPVKLEKIFEKKGYTSFTQPGLCRTDHILIGFLLLGGTARHPIFRMNNGYSRFHTGGIRRALA